MLVEQEARSPSDAPAVRARRGHRLPLIVTGIFKNIALGAITRSCSRYVSKKSFFPLRI